MKKLLTLALLGMTALGTATATSCKKSNPDYAASLAGTWSSVKIWVWNSAGEMIPESEIEIETNIPGEIVITFASDGTYCMTLLGDDDVAGTYTLNGPKLTMIEDSGHAVEREIVELSASKLIIRYFDAMDDEMMKIHMEFDRQ